ncbi:MAG: hypothetical protein CMH83_10510 [Nocardioides sp.]|nr:hypothetical protein [Nocardioides sp.]
MLRGLGILAVGGALVLGGCAADDGADPSASSTAGASGTPSEGASEGASGSPADTPTGEAEQDVVPASGPRVESEDLAYNLPEGWEVRSQNGGLVLAYPEGSGLDLISTLTITDLDGSLTLREAARDDWAAAGHRAADLTWVGTVEVDGQEMYHVTGTVSRNEELELYGCRCDGRKVTVEVVSGPDEERYPDEERLATAASVLATMDLPG